jgi:hypothetical protein
MDQHILAFLHIRRDPNTQQQCESHSGCTHLKVEVKKTQLEVESSTSGNRWKQMERGTIQLRRPFMLCSIGEK